MSFAFPSFLWALSVLSIPIIIHLFNFRKTKRIYFSNNRLLKQIKQETSQKRKLKHLLVLAARSLFLFFLVIAFAQPFLPAKDQITSGRLVVIYLDNSQSMSSKVAEKTRALDDGMARVREIITIFPNQARFKLITNDFAPFSNTFKTKSEIEDVLAQLRLSPVARTFDEIKSRLDADRSSVDIFWVSDFQQSTIGKLTAVDSVNQWHLVPIAYEKSVSNVFVDSVYLDNPFAIGGEKNTIAAKLRNIGSAKREDLVVKLIINGTQSGTTTISCEANGEATVSFDLPSRLGKLNEAKFVVNDFPVSFDNEFFFALNLGEKIKVVEIKSQRSATPIDAVFGNKDLFVVQSFLASNVNYSIVNDADFVVVNELDALDASLQTALKQYQFDGGLVLLIPSAKANLLTYQFLVKNSLSVIEKSEIQTFEKPDFQNPFFSNVFEEKTTGLVMPTGKKLLDWGADRSAILKLKNGQPFLSTFGQTALLAVPLVNEFTNFQNHALFVPIMYRLAASGKKENRNLYYSLDDNFISSRGDSLPTDGQLKLVGDQEIIPAQRRNGDRVLLELPRYIINQGFYHVISQRDTLDLVALNLSKKESLLKQYGGEEVKVGLGEGKNISVFNSSDATTFGSEIKERYLGVNLWKQALVVALLFLLAEVLLIRFLK